MSNLENPFGPPKEDEFAVSSLLNIVKSLTRQQTKQNREQEKQDKKPQPTPLITQDDVTKAVTGFNDLVVQAGEQESKDQTTAIQQMGELQHHHQAEEAHQMDLHVKEHKMHLDQQKSDIELSKAGVEQQGLEAKTQQAQQKADAEGRKVPVATADQGLKEDLDVLDADNLNRLNRLRKQSPDPEPELDPLVGNIAGTRASVELKRREIDRLLEVAGEPSSPQLQIAENQLNMLQGLKAAATAQGRESTSRSEKIRLSNKVRALTKEMQQQMLVVQRFRAPLVAEQARIRAGKIRRASQLSTGIGRDVTLALAEFTQDKSIREAFGADTARKMALVEQERGTQVSIAKTFLDFAKGRRGQLSQVDALEQAERISKANREVRIDEARKKAAATLVKEQGVAEAAQEAAELVARNAMDTAEAILAEPSRAAGSKLSEDEWNQLFGGGITDIKGVKIDSSIGTRRGLIADSLVQAGFMSIDRRSILGATLERKKVLEDKVRRFVAGIKENQTKWLEKVGVEPANIEKLTDAIRQAIEIVKAEFAVDPRDLGKTRPDAVKGVTAGRDWVLENLVEVNRVFQDTRLESGLEAIDRRGNAAVRIRKAESARQGTFEAIDLLTGKERTGITRRRVISDIRTDIRLKKELWRSQFGQE